ncbi:MAG: hypothetical protein Kow00121_46300 [Elainellaceae cyanobacterium]
MAYFSLNDGNNYFSSGNESDWINALGGDDKVLGGWGNDTIYGGSGNDTLEGNGQNDTIYGQEGDDWLVPGTGAYHYIDGGSGTDTVSFADESGGISVNLSSPDANGIVVPYYFAFPSNRTNLVEIENVYGSKGNDAIVGNNQNNQIWGADGFDALRGEGGDDIIDPGLGRGLANGGHGTDTLSLQSFSIGANVDLDRNYDNNYDGSLFYLSGLKEITQGLKGFENVDGSNYNDKIAGNEQANVLKGWAGNDEILGRGGNDAIVGGSGSDSLNGGHGNDTLNGYGSDPVYEHDMLTGGDGQDTFVIGHSFSIYRSNSFATITDFSHGDKISLRGSSHNYRLETDRNGGTTIYFGGTGSSYENPIAYVKNATNLSLANNNQFTFTAL